MWTFYSSQNHQINISAQITFIFFSHLTNDIQNYCNTANQTQVQTSLILTQLQQFYGVWKIYSGAFIVS